MLGESEYRRVFRSPDELRTHSPPQSSTIAGVSSAKLGSAQEPPLPRKKKVPDHDRKVTFTTHHSGTGDPHVEEDVGMRFRAGFRRSKQTTPTEYQLQYTWKASEDGSPLLNAESALRHHPEEHTRKEPPTPEQPLEDPKNDPLGGRGMRSLGGDRHRPEEGRGRREGGDEMRGEADIDLRGLHLGPPNNEGSVDEAPPHGEPPRPLMPPHISSSQPRRHRHHKGSSGKRHHHHHHHRKKHPHRSAGLISEYHAQFKPWPLTGTGKDIAGGEDADEKPLPGAPRVLTDPTDPRLLKHSPLPLASDPLPQPSTQWGSEYSSNFVSPTKYKFVHGAWQGAPHPDLFYQRPLKSVGGREKAPREEEREGEKEREGEEPNVEPEKPEGYSWYQQVVDLHQKAEDYKRRAQGTHFSRELLLQLEDKQRQLFERASSVSSCSMTSSTCTSEGRIVSRSLSPVSEEGSEREERGRGGDIHVDDIESEEAGVGEFYPRIKLGRSKPRVTWIRKPHSNGDDEIDVEPSPASNRHNGDEPLDRSPDELKAPSYEGRVPTPDLQDRITKSTTRHHLDLTTPVDGGVLTSPVKLPFPPTSPRYRKDMRSIAPIFPSPKPKVSELALTKPDTQGGLKGPMQRNPSAKRGLLSHSTRNARHGASTHNGIHPALPTSQPGRLRRTSPNVSHTSEGGAVRQLTFGSRRPHTCDRGLLATDKELCDTCGSVLRSLAPSRHPVHTRYDARGNLHPTKLHAKTTPLTIGGTGRPHSTSAEMGLPGKRRPAYRSTTRSTPNDPLLPHPHTLPLPSSPGPERDVDLHSLSSCSVASDLLRRAQERRDYFWTRPLET